MHFLKGWKKSAGMDYQKFTILSHQNCRVAWGYADLPALNLRISTRQRELLPATTDRQQTQAEGPIAAVAY